MKLQLTDRQAVMLILDLEQYCVDMEMPEHEAKIMRIVNKIRKLRNK